MALLRQAKAESDRRNYQAKNDILRRLLRAYPNRFVIDSDDGRILGLTHPSTNFRIHMPRAAVPDEIQLRRLEGAEGPAKTAGWNVREELQQLYQQSGPRLGELKKAAAELPETSDGYTLWYQPDRDELRLHCASEDAARLAAPLLKLADVDSTLDPVPLELFVEPWCLVKRSFSPALRGTTDALGMTSGPANAWYGGPRPIAATLLGGLAGAGLGYGAGLLGENFAGGHRNRGRLRRTMALLGAGLGAAPGIGWGLYNTSQLGAKGFFSGYPHHGPDVDNTLEKHPDEQVYGSPAGKVVEACCREDYPFLRTVKAAFGAGGGLEEKIPVDAFNEVVWSSSDPFTPPGLRAATVGLVESASLSRGGSPFVTPGDIMRIGLGMGSGYLSSRLVGATLGAMAGLPPEAQQTLQQAGTWAGALKAVVPGAFGR